MVFVEICKVLTQPKRLEGGVLQNHTITHQCKKQWLHWNHGVPFANE